MFVNAVNCSIFCLTRDKFYNIFNLITLLYEYIVSIFEDFYHYATSKDYQYKGKILQVSNKFEQPTPNGGACSDALAEKRITLIFIFFWGGGIHMLLTMKKFYVSQGLVVMGLHTTLKFIVPTDIAGKTITLLNNDQ